MGIVPLEGGELQTGGIYAIVYNSDASTKEHDGWYLLNPTPLPPPKVETFPCGFIATFAMQELPSGWLYVMVQPINAKSIRSYSRQ